MKDDISFEYCLNYMIGNHAYQETIFKMFQQSYISVATKHNEKKTKARFRVSNSFFSSNGVIEMVHVIDVTQH